MPELEETKHPAGHRCDTRRTDPNLRVRRISSPHRDSEPRALLFLSFRGNNLRTGRNIPHRRRSVCFKRHVDPAAARLVFLHLPCIIV